MHPDIVKKIDDNSIAVDNFKLTLTKFSYVIDQIKDFRMSDVEDTINLAKAEMRTEIKDCLSYVHSIRAEMDELQRTLDDARKEDLDEIKTVRDSIAEWTDKKL